MKNNYPAIFVLILVILGTIFFASQTARKAFITKSNPPQSVALASPSVSPSDQSAAVLGTKTKTGDCVSQNGLPDQACTPGAIFPNVSAADICVPGYAQKVRNVSQTEKNQANKAYGLPTKHDPGTYEIDHLISLELGGSNDISNLWPEPANPRPGYHEKDVVENYLHDQVCSGKMSLPQAQEEIAKNWLAVYQQISTK